VIRVGLLSFSDGRERVHQGLTPDIRGHEAKIKAILEQTGQMQVVAASDIVHSAEGALRLAQEAAGQRLDAVLFNIPVFAFPSYPVIAAQAMRVPLLLLGPHDARYPGLGGLLGAAGALSQVGVKHERVWADLDDPAVPAQILTWARAAAAATRLRGQVYGLIGGRSIGMYTGAAPGELWQRLFGVDIDHVDQSEIVRRARLVQPQTAQAARSWLEAHVKQIIFDGVQLTPEKLDFEVRCWIALQEIVDQFGFSFIGLKCHFDMSAFVSVQCLGAAFLNDPYDWRGPKQPVPLACEADSDGALTMQMLTLLTGRPSSLLDVRFLDQGKGVYVMPNCGAAATWFAGRSDDPAENLGRVRIVPSITKYAGGGAHVEFVFAAGDLTFARLSRSASGYRMVIGYGQTEEHAITDVRGASPHWPHAFVRMELSPKELVEKMEANHLHAVAGDWRNELQRLCKILDIEAVVL
jgi:L-fucose isomerase